MFYLPLAVVTWFSVSWMVDRRRMPGLLIYGLVGAALATVQDRLMLIYPLWEYVDTGWIDNHVEIAFLISLSAAPVFAMRFAQGLRPGAQPPWPRLFRYTLVSMLPELVALVSGHIRYHNWWNAGWSVVAYFPIWLAIWGAHRWLTTPQAPPAPAKRQTAPGT